MKKPMKIAIMVRAYIPIPRPSDMIYAPIDLAVEIAKGLGARGHHVTLFAPLGSEINAPNVTLETLNLRPLVHNQTEFQELLCNIDQLSHNVPGLWDHYMVNTIYARAQAGQFDVVHFHHPESALSNAVQYRHIPTVYTMHDPILPWYSETAGLFKSPNQHFVSISNNQRRDAPDLQYVGTAYNGTDVNLFTFSNKHDNYLLFAGRITREKGVKEAIQVAKASKHKLLIIGPIDNGSQDYFDQFIKPELNEKIMYLGRMDQDQLPTYYQNAKAVLTPIQWEEPFGLTTIEAMACGTPVISLRRGAAPELIIDGKTGFIVDTIAEMIEAVGKIKQINRYDCREHVEKHFDINQMVDSYEILFQDIIDNKSQKDNSVIAREYIKRKIANVRHALRSNSKK
jgi:glycosyltransferase involved in cell wall biosynthesis